MAVYQKQCVNVKVEFQTETIENVMQKITTFNIWKVENNIGIRVHKESRNDIFVGVIMYSAIQRDLYMVMV